MTVGGLTPAQVHCFETFGFLHLPGLLADDIERIQRAFDDVVARPDTQQIVTHEEVHHHRRRVIIPRIVDLSDQLSWLRRDARILGIVSSLLGDHHDYHESDGNVLDCDTAWHCDIFGSMFERRHLKLFFYLDPLTADSGAIRFIPGTNHFESPFARELRRDLQHWKQIPEIFGVDPADVPATVVETVPGDVIAGDFRTIHATFGGHPGRRLFTMNYRALAPDEVPRADAVGSASD